MLIPKAEKHKNKKHLIYVSTQNCCVGTDWCSGNIQSHHLLKPFEGKRGFGMRASDKNVVPLCYYHHAQLHDKNGDEDKFWEILDSFRSPHLWEKNDKNEWVLKESIK